MLKKKKRKTTDWKRLEIFSRKLEILKITFHAKMGTIKDRKDMYLTEAEHTEKKVARQLSRQYGTGTKTEI